MINKKRSLRYAGARIAVFTYALLDFRERAIGAVQQVCVVSIPAVIVGERDVFPQVSDLQAVHFLRQVEKVAAQAFRSVNIDIADAVESHFYFGIGAAFED